MQATTQKAERDRCWLTHRRREPWTVCPQCGRPIQWRRTDADGWVPVDEYPAMVVPGGRESVVKHRDLIGGVRLYVPARDRGTPPVYAWRPHYYSCPVLRDERKAWAKARRQKKEEGESDA